MITQSFNSRSLGVYLGPGTAPGPGPSSEQDGQNSWPSSDLPSPSRERHQTDKTQINKEGQCVLVIEVKKVEEGRGVGQEAQP